jgi:hypothetical protein
MSIRPGPRVRGARQVNFRLAADDFCARRGGRAVECTGLENRQGFTTLVSSNLTLSANKISGQESGPAVFLSRLMNAAI